MKYQARGQFVFDPDNIVSVAAAENRVEAERFAAELNRLAKERDALLAACKKARCELSSRFRYAVQTLDEAIRKAEGGAE